MSNAKSELLRSLAARGRSRRVVGVALIAASLTLAGCASAASSAPEVTESEELFSDFVPSAGGEIPDATVPFSMWPYGDTTIGYIGIEEGFFGDVGITLSPEEGQTQLTDVTPGLLLSGELDVVVDYIPTMVQRYEEQPEIQMVQVLNSFIGNYVLAAPDRDATSVEEYVDEGMSFEDATAAVIADMDGATVALSADVASARNLLDGMLQIGGGSVESFGSLESLDDTQIVQLAQGEGVDYTLVSGAAQSIQLLDMGFEPVFGFEQMANNLPTGSDFTALGIGHVGLSVTDEYLDENLETILWFMSVYWRIIDYIETEPDQALAISLPYLNAATGYELTVEESAVLFQDFYQLISFDAAEEFFNDPENPLGLSAIYDAQIAAAQASGVLSDGVVVEDFVVAQQLYDLMVELKDDYEDLAADSSADDGTLAAAAAQASNRNYLDAYRILAAAE